MYLLLILGSFFLVVCGESPKHFVFKKIPVATKVHDSVGATYQAITKRQSGSTTAEILNTVSSPHSSASVSFTTTSADHGHPAYAKPSSTPYVPVEYAKPSASPYTPVEYAKPSTSPYAQVEYAKPTPYPLEYAKLTPTSYPIEYAKHAPANYAPPKYGTPVYPEYRGPYVKPVTPSSHYYDLQNIIVNDQEHAVSEYPIPTYFNYRFAPNQTAIQYPPPLAQASPKAFGYQPVITLANNMKTFYKVNQYAPFVVAPNQYYDYANNDITNSYAPSEPTPYPYLSYPASPLVVSYNDSILPYVPPPSHEGYSLVPAPAVPKPYKDNAYLEPERPLYRPVLILNKYAS